MRAGRPFLLGVGSPNNPPEQGGGAVEQGRRSGGAVEAGGGAARSYSTFKRDRRSRLRDKGEDPRLDPTYTLVLLTIHDLVFGVLKVPIYTQLNPGLVAGKLQPRGTHKGEVGSKEERLEAEDHREAGGGDLTAGSVEVARALPHAEEGM